MIVVYLPGLGIAALAAAGLLRAVDVETTEDLEQEFKAAWAPRTTVIVVRTQPEQAMLVRQAGRDDQVAFRVLRTMPPRHRHRAMRPGSRSGVILNSCATISSMSCAERRSHGRRLRGSPYDLTRRQQEDWLNHLLIVRADPARSALEKWGD